MTLKKFVGRVIEEKTNLGRVKRIIQASNGDWVAFRRLSPYKVQYATLTELGEITTKVVAVEVTA